ncbi:hypothetical protein BDZ89DRAFT_1078766 [Hymenopellis radicata]|nr:hypothetical protein BDZ89DRAFT_1078766 [Hymenopellis radicata]
MCSVNGFLVLLASFLATEGAPIDVTPTPMDASTPTAKTTLIQPEYREQGRRLVASQTLPITDSIRQRRYTCYSHQ